MPTVLRTGTYRFFFYVNDRDEPPHVHVEREDKLIKFWLDPIRLQYSIGFIRHEIRRIERIIQEQGRQLLEAWNAYFNG